MTFCAALMSILSGCGGTVSTTSEDAGLLRIDGLAEETTVRIDGLAVGTLSEFPIGIPLRAGTIRVELHPPNSLVWRAEVEMLPGAILEWRLEPWPLFEEVDQEGAAALPRPPGGARHGAGR